MTLSVVFRPQAEDEVNAARQWYEAHKTALGAKFADALDDVVSRIAANPSAFPLVHGEIRRAVMRQFPYGLYFRIHIQTIVVIAVTHGRRHPSQWQSRV